MLQKPYMSYSKKHRAKLHNTNPIERLNGEIKRRTEVVGIFPNDEWAAQRDRYMTLETISQITDDPIVRLPAVAS